MSREGNSIRKLPPGKLRSLRQQFEEKDAQASGALLYGILPTLGDDDNARPTSTVVQPRVISSVTSSPALSARKTWLAPDFVTSPTPVRFSKKPDSVPQVFGYRRQCSDPERQKSPSPAGGRGVSLTRPLALHSDSSSTLGQGNRGGRFGAELRGDTAAKRLSSDTVTLRESVKQYAAERQRTMSDASSVRKPKELSVRDMLKQFEEKSTFSSKPVVTVVGQNMSSVSNAQRRVGKSNGQSNGSTASALASPKTERNFDWLKLTPNEQSATAGADKSTVSSRQNSTAMEALLSPPAKPPRTFAHDEYLLTKINSTEHSGAQNAKDRQSEEKEFISVKERVNVFSGGSSVKEEVVLRTQGGYAHLNQNRNAQSTCDFSYNHAQPHRLRPISENTALVRHTDGAQSTDHSGATPDSDGPVVVSLKYGRKLEPPPKVEGRRRNPSDKLPETPKPGNDLQEFKLRKSYSSECLDKGSTSSLSEAGEELSVSRCGRRSSCLEKGQVTHHYETLAEKESSGGLLGRKEQNGVEGQQYAEVNKRGLQKRPVGPSPSDGAATSLLTAMTTATATATATPITEQDVEKVPSTKMILVKQKINQAYEVLNVVFNQRPKSVSEVSEDDESQESADHFPLSEDTVDSDSTVDAKEIKQRVTYCSSVRLKTSQSIKKAREFSDKIYPQLFEYALIVGLCAKEDKEGYDPYVIRKFPQMVNCDISIPKFCFPDVDEFQNGTVITECESYSFVLTNIDGARLYGYCRRIQPADSTLPEVLCIVSPVDGFNMYNKLLMEIEVRRSKSLDHAQELIEASFGRPLPSPGRVSHIRFMSEKDQVETIFLERPQDQRLTNVNYESLLQYLGTDKLIKVFSSILMERRLILCSQNLSILTQTIHALVALLYPLRWQHVYIPLLPPDMLDVCAAPMPFIIGILRAHLDRVTCLELEDVIIVDLDKKQVLRCVGDEATILPKKVQKALKTALNMCKIDSDTMSNQWLMVSEAFLRMFLEVMGHFGQYVSTQQDGHKTLLKEQFIASVPSKGIRQFLEWFTETQMFEVFINSQVDKCNGGSLDLFMSRLGELQSKRQDGSHSRGLGRKVKDLGKAIKTKLK